MDRYTILNAIKEDINPWYFLFYLIVINLIGFCIMGLDKYKAKKGKWRTPEKTLFTITLLGGGIGTTAGMYHFRHKTKKMYFTIGLPTITIAEYLFILYMIIFV